MRTSSNLILQHPSWFLSKVCRDNVNSNAKATGKYLAYFIKTLRSRGGGAWHRAPPPGCALDLAYLIKGSAIWKSGSKSLEN